MPVIALQRKANSNYLFGDGRWDSRDDLMSVRGETASCVQCADDSCNSRGRGGRAIGEVSDAVCLSWRTPA